MILGLDSSSKTTGYSFFNGQEVIDAGFIDTSKLSTNREKTLHIVSVLASNSNMSSVAEIKLEAFLSGFKRGKTSQKIVIMLARFNATLEYVLNDKFNVPVRLVSANTARKSVLGKAFIKGMPAKEYVKRNLPKKFPEVKKFEKMNNKNEWNAKNGDMYDAVVISAS